MRTDIVRLTSADADLLARIAPDVFDAPIDPRKLAAYLADPGHLLVVAITDGEVVGQARGIVHRHPDLPTDLYIDNLGVTPDRRRERLAMKLLDELLAWSREYGCETAWVATEADNAPARALYARRGATAELVAMFSYPVGD